MVQRRATLADVARLAGVSSKTASRVFSDKDKVSPATIQAVLSAAQRLRFRPNALARNLRHGGAPHTFGFVMGELENPFYYAVAAGIQSTLDDHGITLIVATTSESAEGEQRVADELLAQRVGALLLIPVSDDQAYLQGERQLGTPVISIDRPARNLIADSVVLQNREGARQATLSLIEHGHRRIAYACNPASVFTQKERLAGYHDALQGAGIPLDVRFESLLDDLNRAPEEVIRKLLAMEAPPTAIIAGNNRMCIGALRAMREMVHPPALIGFDDFNTADILDVTVVSYDAHELGRRAAQLAIERMVDSSAPPIQIELPTYLIRRGSGERPPTQ
ncbi:LacI family DNA-binding transcriptional regulator [Arthrobacter psychrochitiniphilus]|uniref:LacI family DNA-binding transcriptional regulator n=1 Tax=Arthrobacter psychrochitiniphilus TaxID=291045 RepID=UPI003F7C434F